MFIVIKLYLHLPLFLKINFHTIIAYPSGYIAKILDILAPVTSILITCTLLTVFFTVKTDQYKENLKEIITFSDSQLDKLEKLLLDNHKYTIDEALKFLESKKSYVCVIVKEIDKILT